MIPKTGRSVRSAVTAAFGALALSAVSALPVAAPVAQAQEAASAVHDVALQDVSFSFGGLSASAPSLTVSGTRLSKEQLLGILRVDGTEPWPLRLARLEAGGITAPELRFEQRDGARRQVTVYRDIAARGLKGGRVAEVTAAGATLSVEGGAQPGKGSYGKIRAEDIDLAALAGLYAEAGDGKGPLTRIYAAFSIADIDFSDEETLVKAATFGGRDFSGRQVPSTWNGAMSAIGAIEDRGEDPLERAKLSANAADLLEAFAMGSLEATGLTIRSIKEDPGDLTIARLAYAGGGAQEGLTISDVGFAAAGTRARIATIRLAGFSLAPTVATLRRMAVSADTSESELRKLMPQVGTLSVAGFGLDVEPDGSQAPASEPADPLAKPPPGQALRLGLRDASMTLGPPKDGMPTAGRLNMTGLTLPAALVAGIPGLAALETYGYRDLDLTLVADMDWNESSKDLAFKEISVSGKDMGRLRLNATLGGITPDVFDPTSANATFAMLSATAKVLDLSLENGGLFERFIDAQAKSLSLKPDELKQEYVTASVVGIPVILGNSEAAKAIGAAMGRFVTKPGTLSISAKAKNGGGLGVIDFSTAATPGAVLDKLDVQAKSE